MSAVLAALAGAAAYGAYNSISQKRQNKATRENMETQERYNMENLRQAPALSAEGFRNAGLNPASVSGGASFSAPAVASHPGSAGSGIDFANPLVSAVASDNLLQLQSEEIDNLRAKTSGVETENEIKATELRRLQAEDDTLSENMRDYFEAMKKEHPDKSALYEKLIQRSFKQDFNAGTLLAMSKFEKRIQEASDIQLKVLDNQLMTKVKNHQLRDESGIWQAIAKRPQDERVKMYGDFNKVNQEIKNLVTSEKLTSEQVKETVNNAKKILVDMDKTYHTDFVGMIDKGDNFLATMYLLKDLSGAFAEGAGYGFGSSVTPAGRANIGKTKASTALDRSKIPEPEVKPYFPHPSGYTR